MHFCPNVSSSTNDMVHSFRSSSLTGMAGAMKPEGMITKKIKLDQVAEEGFKALIDDKENQVKILVDVGAGI